MSSAGSYSNAKKYLSVVRSLADVVADGELESLVLVLLPSGDDPWRVQELQLLLRLLP